MVIPQGLGDKTRQADWNEKGESCHRPKDCRGPPLHLGGRHFVRVGPTEDSLIVVREFLAWSTEPAMSRWDGGCGDLVYSAGGGSPYPAAHVEAPDRTSS
jgi:hypothetical protein